MSVWDKYPYTDFHELNLDWIIKMVKEVTKEMNDFKVVNQIVWGGLHDPGKEYPRWCIVDTPTHEGYISIQPVPAGITIDNEDYWRQVANYSALYADFQNRIVALEDDMDLLTHRRVLFVGDSYAVSLPKNYPEYVAEYLGLSSDDYYVAARGGAGYHGYGGENTFLSCVEAIYPNIVSPETITDIVIVSAYNDIFENPITVAPYYTALINYLRTNFANAKIYQGWCGCFFQLMTASVHDNIKKLMNTLTSPWATPMTNLEYVMVDSGWTGDDEEHPTDLGSQVIAYRITEFLLGKNIDIAYGPTALQITNASGFSNSTLEISVEMKNGVKTIHFKGDVIPDSAIIFTSTLNVVGTYGKGLIWGNSAYKDCITVNADIYVGGTLTKNIPVKVLFGNDSVNGHYIGIGCDAINGSTNTTKISFNQSTKYVGDSLTI